MTTGIGLTILLLSPFRDRMIWLDLANAWRLWDEIIADLSAIPGHRHYFFRSRFARML
jgi:hypothetical protein